MTALLKGLTVDEISFCPPPGPRGRAANPHCNVVVHKREPETAWIVVEEVALHDIAPTRPASGKSRETRNMTKTQPMESEDHMDAISKGAAAEATLDVLVLKRQEQYPDESEAVAMTKILATKAGQQAYAAMVYGKDLEVAKSSTLLTHGTDTKKVGSASTEARGAATDAASELDRLAKLYAAKNSVSFHAGYLAVLQSVQGRALYAQTCGAPAAASGAGSGQNEDAHFPRAQIAAA